MKPAKCRACGKEAMTAVDLQDAEVALAHHNMGASMAIRLECAYCGGQQSTRDREEIRHAFIEGDLVRKRVTAEVESERAKVARLKEGRW